MMKRMTRLIVLPLVCLYALSLPGFPVSQTSEAYADEVFEQLWFGMGVCEQSKRLEMTLTHPDKSSTAEAQVHLVEIVAPIPYQATRVSMTVKDSEETSHHHAMLDLNLQQGRNQLTFEWDASALVPGAYTLMVEADYADDFPLVTCRVPFKKVSCGQWTRDIAVVEESLAGLEGKFRDLPEDLANAEYLRIQFNMAQDMMREARTALADRAWQRLDQRVEYLKTLSDTLHAGIVFGGSVMETPAFPDAPSLDGITIQNGGFYVDERPVYLFGIALDADAPLEDQLQRLQRYGLNFSVKTMPVSDSSVTLIAELEAALDAVKAAGIALAVQFNQEHVVGAIMDQWPELLDTGFVNMAHTEFSSLYADRLIAMASALNNKPIVVCASVARGPQFKYDGEEVRQHFISRVEERYPDRIELNRLWRSHLADYDEITIWGEHPEYRYQNRRAYQYEWQTFHRELITLALARLEQDLAEYAPSVPTTVTLPNSAFSTGETRYDVNREAVAAMMDLHGCSAASGPGETLYAMSYPLPQAYYTLMRSYAPSKPVMNFAGDIELDGVHSSAERGALTRSAVWEAVMSGVNGLALPARSAVPECPEALAAFVFAARDINRLAPVVAAFQQAPPEIAILFSEASKIMDDGIPHLESAKFAFEGASFAGFTIRFITESQINAGALSAIRVLILPETMAVSDATFELLSQFVDDGGTVARVGTPIPYNERGHSRNDVIRSTSSTVLVRGMNLPTEYLHAMDAAQDSGALPEIARPINAFGYPLEGVRSRYVEYEGDGYLYIINLRRNPVTCNITGVSNSGRDLIQGRDIVFPRVLPPLEPMLIRMERSGLSATMAQQ